jgi:transcriptional regulator with XRE-family HTH domain
LGPYGYIFPPMPASPRRTDEQKQHAREVGARIRARRRALGKGITKVAGDAGISADHLYNLERGQHLAYGRTLSRIAGALNTSVSALNGAPISKVA